MICPHCGIGFHESPYEKLIDEDPDGGWILVHDRCPECKKLIIQLKKGTPIYNASRSFSGVTKYEMILVRPKGTYHPPCPSDVPDDYAEDYKEACLVLADSPKASAALSRRCLQNILRNVAKVNHGKLYDEIEEILDRKTLPSHIAESIDAVRSIGNFAAHPMKSKSTGEIIDVEPGEAEWNLDVLEALFDYYFVQPEKTKKRKDALNKKLKEVDKSIIK